MDAKLKIIFFLLIPTSLFAKFRVSEQKIMDNPDASILHFVGSAYLSSSLEECGLKWYQADLITLGLGLSYEIKDGFVPYEKHGIIGGEGFSKNDLLCDFMGVVTNRLFHIGLKKLGHIV